MTAATPMHVPTVSFIVPCYRLAHLLPECIESILMQSYRDFELLIMDDCSPDHTPQVSRSFPDSRVKYIRNEHNLGHLRNYNKGISLSQGKYVWLISADDRLRRPYVLERYVRLMEQHPEVGYVCCPGVGLDSGVETNLVDCGYYGPEDKILNGREFIAKSLRYGYGLLAPSVMVRRSCYENISNFPLDMPHQGDWYLWFIWALEYDVAYFGEPMVNYRSHDLNIMKDLMAHAPNAVFRDEVTVLSRTKYRCQLKGFHMLAGKCGDVLAANYARAASAAIYPDIYSHVRMSLHDCDQALRAEASSESEYRRLRAKFIALIGNRHWHHGAFGCASSSYRLALHEYWGLPIVWIKLLLLTSGLGRWALRARELKLRHVLKLQAFRRSAERSEPKNDCIEVYSKCSAGSHAKIQAKGYKRPGGAHGL